MKIESVRVSPIHPFTDRQADVLQRMAQGQRNSEIAKGLGIAEHTVQNHICGSGIRHPNLPLDHVDQTSRSELGIFGVIEIITGDRPVRRADAVMRLLDDVVFIEPSH